MVEQIPMAGESSSTQRERMVLTQIVRRGIKDPRVLAAMRLIPRDAFVTAGDEAEAYQDRPLPIGHQQTISQPYIVAYMSEQLHIQPEDTVLDIGTGSGYQAAIFSRLAKHVYTIEYVSALAKKAAKLFEHLHYENITVIEGDGSAGLPQHAPFDVILAAASAPSVPEPLLEQLSPGGRMILPIGNRDFQVLRLVTKQSDGRTEYDDLIQVVFVPLRGQFGWKEGDWTR